MERIVLDLVSSSSDEDPKPPRYALLDPSTISSVRNVRAAVEDYYTILHIPGNIKTDVLPRLMTLNDGALYQAPSTLPGAGNGVYCARSLRAGEIITYYDGVRVTVAVNNRLYAQHSKTASSYAQQLEDTQIILGNVTGSEPVYQDTQVRPEVRAAGLRFLRAEEMGRHFHRKGAGQLLNSVLTASDPQINARLLCIRDRRRFTKDELLAASEDVPPEPSDTLASKYPDGIVNVLYATRDIPAHTELLYYYGKRYVEENFGCANHHCPLYTGDGDDKARYCSRECNPFPYLSSSFV